jgi:hypothetical protein
MEKNRYEQALHGIEGIFAKPQDIKDATDLTKAQKIELLRQWEQDLRELILASGEGMIARNPGRASELLGNVEIALNELAGT